MIETFKVKNFLSFKDEISFDLRATRDKKLGDYGITEKGKSKLLNFALIYGPNAAGKSNLLKAINFIRMALSYKPESKDKEIPSYTPFLLSSETKGKPSEFEIIFYQDNLRYEYCLKINFKEFLYESLSVYKSNKPSLIFERKNENEISYIEFGNSENIDSAIKKELEIKCLKNMSVLSSYEQLNFKNVHIENLLRFTNSIWPIFTLSELGKSSIYELIKEKIHTNSNFKDEIINKLKIADFNISNISTEKYEANNIENIEQKKVSLTRVNYIHKVMENNNLKEYILPEQLESQGTIKFIFTIGIFELLSDDSIFLIDEIENSIHPKLAISVIKNFISNRKKSQLISTTHNDTFLEYDDVIRKDNIWFVSKKEDGSSDVYPLTDFNGVNRISSLRKAYQYGRFGAIPDIEDL